MTSRLLFPYSKFMGIPAQSNKFVRNFGFFIIGASLGLVFFSLFVLVLNYYFNFLSFDFLPHQTRVKKTTISIQREKAKLAGYEVIWEGDPNDFTGRTILTSKAHSDGDWVDKFGWTNASFGTTATDIYRGMGTFSRWEKLSKSNDFYAVLFDPNLKKEFKARILVDKSLLSATVGLQTPNGANLTRLIVENLDYGPNNKSIKFSEKIGNFYELKKETLNKIIKKGDVVTVYTIPVSLNPKAGPFIRRDENNIPAIISFMIRRFGGKEQLEKELNK